MSFSLKDIQIDLDMINIVSTPSGEKVLGSLIHKVGIFTREIEARLNSKLLRLSKEKIKIACQIVGCKPSLAKSISDSVFHQFEQLVKLETIKLDPNESTKHFMYTTKTSFLGVLKEEFERNNLNKERSIFDFELALSIIEQTRSMIVLLGGTSGSGKSTVASLLASRFGIPTVLSTDSIRHIMKNFMTVDECPVLFCSTYEAGNKIKVEEGVKDNKRIVMGFQQQAVAVQQRLENILKDFYNRGESIVVEGVHITPDFMTSMIKKFDNCLPFLIYISNENKHRERFAVRSKYMTLEKRLNKYVQNFDNIRCIQKHLTKKAEEYLIPKVDNSNVDKSVGLVHRTMVRCLRRISIGESLYDHENNKAFKIYEQFNAVTKNIWSSEAVKKYIHAKSKKAHKSEIFKRFFEQNAKPMDKALLFKIEPDQRHALLDNPPLESLEKENIDINRHYNEDEDEDHQTVNKIKPSLAFKEDFMQIETNTKVYSKEENSIQHDNCEGDNEEISLREEHESESPQRPPRGNTALDIPSKEYENTMDLDLYLEQLKDEEETKAIVGEETEHIAANISKEEDIQSGFVKDSVNIRNGEIKLEEKGNLQPLSPQFSSTRWLEKFNTLEEMINNKKAVTIRGLTSYNIGNLRRWINHYNARHYETFLKLYFDNQRYVIYKHNKYEKDNSPRVLPNSTSEMPIRTLSRFATKRFDDYVQKLSESDKNGIIGKSGYNHTSDENVEASDEDSMSVTSQEKYSNRSGSLDINLYMMKRGSTYYNLSEKFEMSDDLESLAIPEGEADTSLEFLQSGNSISEQTIEEDEDEDITMNPMPSRFEKNKLTHEEKIIN